MEVGHDLCRTLQFLGFFCIQNTMGYATLDAALAFPNNLAPSNSHIVVTDTLKSDANFLIHHFIGNQLKGDKHVVLVGLAQIFNHYFLISRKLVT